jgi:hypothetical protein
MYEPEGSYLAWFAVNQTSYLCTLEKNSEIHTVEFASQNP